MSDALKATARWIEQMVIGEALCPFAKAPWQKREVRLVQSDATSEQTLVEHLAAEVLALMDAHDIATTVLVHPNLLSNFGDYNDFLDVADEVLRRLGAEGVLQIASFHPDYCFADAQPDDAANYTNRSPFPMLHLLREDHVEHAVAQVLDAANIPTRNVRHMRDIGSTALSTRLSALRRTP